MEIEKMNCKVDREKEEEEEDVPLPGFRFHPTDEELVGFYLRRKVEKRPISIELIKQIDIYKYDPWDLPKGSNVGDKEWYFFCKRGRKYRNSIRPNRVTGSGFWKATGIDRPIYGEAGRRDCIGLKKSLVYYRGSAGKGTKTDWMMHEFRLPPPEDKTTKIKHNNIIDNNYAIPQEAEVWTLCRILKRSISSYKKGIPDWRELAAAKRTTNTNVLVSAGDTSSQTCSGDSSDHNTDIKQGYNLISFQNPEIREDDQKKPFLNLHHHQQQQQGDIVINGSQVQLIGQNRHLQVCSTMSTTTTSHQLAPSTAASYSNYPTNLDINDHFAKHGDWDDLRSVVEFAVGTDPTYFMQ